VLDQANMLRFVSVLLVDGPLTLREFMTHEPVPLATIFREVLAYLATRKDAVVHGAHAVNAYADPERMTADIDLLATDAASLASDLRILLSDRFHMAVRVREVVPGGYRVFQLREPKNRHLIDLRQVAELPRWRTFDGVQVVEPTALLAMKVISMVAREGREKGLTDRLDLHRLLRAFPQLREKHGEVAQRLQALGVPDKTLVAWQEVVAMPLAAEPDDE